MRTGNVIERRLGAGGERRSRSANSSDGFLGPALALLAGPTLRGLAGATLLLLIGSSLFAAEPTAEQVQFFEAKIRPILVENCQKCHGEQKQSGQLRLDSAAGLLSGGESGPAVVPGEPDKSLLVEAVQYKSLEMPPAARLKPEQVALLVEWVKLGAAWPGASDTALVPRKGGLVVTDADREHWSFRPVVRPEVPLNLASGVFSAREGREAPGSAPSTLTSFAVEDYREADASRSPQSAIDCFVLERLAEKGLGPSPPAGKQQLIRRLSFDLTGLPPSVDQITAFAADERPDAYERAVDRLLATPQFGERWARHWLDVVRFAQTNGYERDSEKPLAWRYRDYVIRALNQDKPYDQFLIEQLAGDELEPVTDDSLSATGYYRLGVWDDEPDDGKQAKADEFDDIVSTTASAMLGLTLGCARCHDHKFDPLGQEDYYSFTAFFQNIRLYGKVADVVGGGQPVDKEGVFRTLPSGAGETLCVRERDERPPQTFVMVRGNAHTLGKEVRPRFLEVLSPTELQMWPYFPEGEPSAGSRGRRLALAEWIASRENPLTARVVVNRLWQHHFGRGIVPTASDFGRTGVAPSHPELLDYLASELVEGGWEIKRLHRAIVCSATYKQSSSAERGVRSAEQIATVPSSEFRAPRSIDPDNTLLWRQNLRRLEAEAVRDAVLAASGELNLQMGGRGVFPMLPREVLEKQSRPGNGWDKSPADQQARRSVYIFVKRTLGVPLLESFDVASSDIPIAERSVTTVAPQALILLNSDFMQQQAAALAERVNRRVEPTRGRVGPARAASAGPPEIDAVYQFALGRNPNATERTIALRFLDRWQNKGDQALVELCKLVLNLNEFIYID